MYTSPATLPEPGRIAKKRSFSWVSWGSAIAIQNFFENLSMLVLVSGYAAVTFMHVPVDDTAFGLGLLIALTMGALTWHDTGPRRPRPKNAPMSKNINIEVAEFDLAE